MGRVTLLGCGKVGTSAGPAVYVGPGEVAGWDTAYGYWGMRAYTAAKIGTPCIEVCPGIGGASSMTVIVSGADGFADLSGIGYSPIYLNRFYDQSGSPAQDLFFNSGFERPALIANIVGGQRAPFFTGGVWGLTASNATALAQPLSIGVVYRGATWAGAGIMVCDGTFGFLPFYVSSAGSLSQNFNSTTVNYVSVPDNTVASAISIASSTPLASGASSTMCMNGNTPMAAGDTPGTNGIRSANKFTVGATDTGGGNYQGHIYEVIVKAGMVSAANQTALSVNQHTKIGTGWT